LIDFLEHLDGVRQVRLEIAAHDVEDFDEDGPGTLAEEDEAIAGNGAAPEIDLLEESPPATAEEASEAEAGPNGAEPQPQPTEE